MTNARDALAALEAQHDRQRFMSLPMDARMRNTCRGCGCRLIEDFARAFAFVSGPPKLGQCRKCGWIGTK